MSDKWNTRGRNAANAVKRGAEATANSVHDMTNAVARNETRVADGTQAVTQTVGSGMDRGGQMLAAIGKQASKTLHGNASRAADLVRDSIQGSGRPGTLRTAAGVAGWLSTKVAVHIVGLAANAATIAGKVAEGAGRIVEKSAPAVGGTVGGVLRGAAEVTSNALDAAALPASSIEDMRGKLRSLGLAEAERSETLLLAIKSAQSRRRKDELLDLLVVSGVTLAQILRDPGSVPAEVERAFALAYPGLAQAESLSEAVSRMSEGELVGLVSGIKGKLFEIELVDHLNNGGLPEGFHAELAKSVTQPGWDVRVLDQNGDVSELLQAKATESAQYVKEALDRYPGIDVTTTTEVHAQLVALGLAQNVHDSGISEAALQAKVEAAMQGGATFDASDLVPSSIGLAVIALSVFVSRETTLREKGAAFGTRSAKAGASSAAGKAIMVATQTWWLGLIAGVGSSWLTSHGQGKRQQYEVLRAALKVMGERHPHQMIARPRIG